MRTAILTVLFSCTLFFAASTQTASAEEISKPNNNDESTVVALLSEIPEQQTLLELINTSEDEEPEQQAEPEVIQHKVQENENLTDIAKKYSIEWKRIFYKNIHIEDPNVINPGEVLVIPSSEESLQERTIPVRVEVVVPAPATTVEAKPVAATARPAARGGSNGNLYVAGYCTWYVKNMRPDLPNNLGNAITWVSRAAAQGMATGSSPRVGAVGQRGNHVVYVEGVNTDGTVTISEMNHKGLYVRTVRTLPASYFTYIY